MAVGAGLAGILLSVALARGTTRRRPSVRRPAIRPAPRWTRIPAFLGLLAALAVGFGSLDYAVPLALVVVAIGIGLSVALASATARDGRLPE